MTLEIEQTVFDYFGIITPEYDMSITYWNKNMDFVANRLKKQAEVSAELVPKEDKPLTR